MPSCRWRSQNARFQTSVCNLVSSSLCVVWCLGARSCARFQLLISRGNLQLWKFRSEHHGHGSTCTCLPTSLIGANFWRQKNYSEHKTSLQTGHLIAERFDRDVSRKLVVIASNCTRNLAVIAQEIWSRLVQKCCIDATTFNIKVICLRHESESGRAVQDLIARNFKAQDWNSQQGIFV